MKMKASVFTMLPIFIIFIATIMSYINPVIGIILSLICLQIIAIMASIGKVICSIEKLENKNGND